MYYNQGVTVDDKAISRVTVSKEYLARMSHLPSFPATAAYQLDRNCLLCLVTICLHTCVVAYSNSGSHIVKATDSQFAV